MSAQISESPRYIAYEGRMVRTWIAILSLGGLSFVAAVGAQPLPAASNCSPAPVPRPDRLPQLGPPPVSFDRDQAWQDLNQRAQRGEAQAQYDVAQVYQRGCFFDRAIPKDDTAAVEWYRRAAEQGHAGAQSKLGQLYETGQGLPQDYAGAKKWYEAAIKHDAREAADARSIANHGLGRLYAAGHGVARDDALAVRFFKESYHAHEDLSDMYAAGRGVPQDLVQAYMWLNIDDERLRVMSHVTPTPNPARAEKQKALVARMTPQELARAKDYVDGLIHGRYGGVVDDFGGGRVSPIKKAQP